MLKSAGRSDMKHLMLLGGWLVAACSKAALVLSHLLIGAGIELKSAPEQRSCARLGASNHLISSSTDP